MSGKKCSEICFECPYQDCIISTAEYATPWEKEFKREQRKIRREKEKNRKAAGSGAPGYGTLLFRH